MKITVELTAEQWAEILRIARSGGIEPNEDWTSDKLSAAAHLLHNELGLPVTIKISRKR